MGFDQAIKWAFTWITAFPLFEYSDTEKRFVSTHHPFTSPLAEDIPFLTTDPGRVRARAYDLVLNGSEIGGAVSASTSNRCRP